MGATSGREPSRARLVPRIPSRSLAANRTNRRLQGSACYLSMGGEIDCGHITNEHDYSRFPSQRISLIAFFPRGGESIRDANWSLKKAKNLKKYFKNRPENPRCQKSPWQGFSPHTLTLKFGTGRGLLSSL